MRNRLLALLGAAGIAVVSGLQLSPVAAAGPAVSFSASPIDFGSAPWLQSAPTQNLVVTNTGDQPLSICCADMSGNSFIPQDFVVFIDQCSFHTINPGAQCSIFIRFTPQSGGPRTQTLSIFDNAPGSPQTVVLTGTATGAVVRFTSSFFDFGTVQAGTTSAPFTMTAVNAGDGPVTISQASLGSTGSTWFALTQNGCAGATLGPGQRCSVAATVTPDGVTSAQQTVTLVDNAGSGQQRFQLFAEGGGPLLSVLNGVPRLNQGVGTSSPVALPIFNAGTQPLQIASAAIDNPAAGFSIAHDGCSGSILAFNPPFNTPPPSCEMDLVFAPPATGTLSANLVFHDNELGGTHSVSLTSSGYAPVAVASPVGIDFGFQAPGTPSATRSVTLTNPSPQPLTVSAVSLGGNNPGQFSITANSCSAGPVAPGGSCTVGVAFTPPSAFLFTATVSFATNAPAASPTVSLRGEGSTPTFTISTSSLSFGNEKANFTSPAQTVTVTNLSPTPSSYGFMPQAGVHASGCTGFVAPGTSCPVSVTINSPAVGAQNALLRIIDSNSNLQVVEADWTGTSGVAFFTDGVINNHIFQVVGTTTTVTGQVLNSGSDTLNVGQVFLTGSPPATISNDGCSNTVVAAGHSCTFLITATPTVLGNWATTITVPTDAAVGPNPAMMVLDGSAFPPDPAQAVFSPASVTFPNQPVGTVATQVVWLDNGLVPAFGAQSLTVSSTALGGPDASAYSIVWDGCSGTSVDAAFSCPVEVAFAPAAGGAFSASLLFNDNASGSPQAVALVGVGAAPATVSPLQVDFGQVGVNTHSAPVTVTLTNTSTATFSVSRVTISGLNKGDFTVASDGCSHQTLAPGQACQVTLDFRPEASGDRSATVTFEDTAANSPQSAPLTGVGIGK